MTLGRLHPSDEYDIRIATEEGEDGQWIALLVEEIEHFSGETARLAAENAALAARLVAAEAALEVARKFCSRVTLHVLRPTQGRALQDAANETIDAIDEALYGDAALAASREQATTTTTISDSGDSSRLSE